MVAWSAVADRRGAQVYIHTCIYIIAVVGFSIKILFRPFGDSAITLFSLPGILLYFS